MNILITIDYRSIMRFIADYEDYKLNFKENWLKKLDDEYRCYK